MKRRIEIGDRVVFTARHSKRNGFHGVVVDRTERGNGLGFITIRVLFDHGDIDRFPVSWFSLEKVREDRV